MKHTITSYNRNIIFYSQTTTAKTASDVRDTFKRTPGGQKSGLGIGTYVPNKVPASKSYWQAWLLDMLAMRRELGKPSFYHNNTKRRLA